MRNPMEQYKIEPIIRIYNKIIDITITKGAIYQYMAIIIIIIMMGQKERIKKTRTKELTIEIYKKTEEILKGMIPKTYEKYIGMIKGTLIIITISNIIGLIPYSYTTTGQIIITITMSMTIIIGITIRGIKKHGYEFRRIFIPKGITGMIKPVIIMIEIISYIIRIISLAVRLTANIVSGHTLIKIIGTFGYKYTKIKPIIGIIPIMLLMGIYLLEIGVSIIQGYVFTLLMVTYIKDIEEIH